MLAACARRKARHVERVRCGAGWRPASSSTLRTEVAETGMPRLLSSPTIRLYPQCGFSLARRRISSRSEHSSGGRPSFRCAYVHRRAISWRCQRSSVSGLNVKTVQAGRGSERGSAIPTVRDQLVSASAARPVGEGSPAHGGGPGSPTPSSDAAAPAATPARTGSARRDTQTTRASSPPSTTARAPEPSEPGNPREPRASLRTLRGYHAPLASRRPSSCFDCHILYLCAFSAHKGRKNGSCGAKAGKNGTCNLSTSDFPL